MITDPLGGQVDYTIEALSAVMQHSKSGKMLVLAVRSPKRVFLFPTVPTLSEFED